MPVTGRTADPGYVKGDPHTNEEIEDMTDKRRADGIRGRLTEDELDAISGGPTEELFGAYHFLLEAAGTKTAGAPGSFKPPIGSDKGS